MQDLVYKSHLYVWVGERKFYPTPLICALCKMITLSTEIKVVAFQLAPA